MSYVWRLWCAFAMVLIVVLTAMAFMTATALRLERAEAAARRRAVVDENLRLALWRMDFALAPLLAQESAHPFYALDGQADIAVVATHGDRSVTTGRWSPGPEPAHHVLLRFRLPIDRPTDSSAEVADRLARQVPLAKLLAKLPTIASGTGEPRLSRDDVSPLAPDPLAVKSVQSRAATEFQQRSQSLMMNNALVQQLQTQQRSVPEAPVTMMTPVWVPDRLLLARRVNYQGGMLLQGCLLDWGSMQQWLLALINDLLPNARLEPMETFDATGEAGMLAALPVRLLPGPLPAASLQRRSAVPQTLAVAWCAVALSSAIGAALIAGVVRLSQRREDFVSAVTHELRTPLTTFRMYSEMLAQGMVRDPGVQRQYLQTLQDQSLRLSHLVENVLAYARLERGRTPTPSADLPLAQLIDPVLPHLQQLTAAQQMELVVQHSASFDLPLRINRSAVEQILINLVDNACKYARDASDRRICLSASAGGRYVALRVRDYGPGLPAKRRWFQPFNKTAQQAAHSAPGVGLGLGLSRRLAQQMGGQLDVDRTVTDGAVLVLRLPLAEPAKRGSVGESF